MKIIWGTVLVVFVTPLVWAELAYILSRLRIPMVMELAALFTGGALVALLMSGLRRNWQASRTGWVIIATFLLGSGILANLAVRQVKSSSQDKSVLGNIRQLSAAADQYFLEYGVTSVEIQQLVGATNYIKVLNPITNEVYPGVYTAQGTITVTGIAGLRTVTYAP